LLRVPASEKEEDVGLLACAPAERRILPGYFTNGREDEGAGEVFAGEMDDLLIFDVTMFDFLIWVRRRCLR
jgi:hypothetical protein